MDGRRDAHVHVRHGKGRLNVTDASTTIVHAPEGIDLARPAPLSRESIDLLSRTIASGANDAELALFVQTCNRLELDPFARQIYLVPRWTEEFGKVMQAQVSIDGFRLVAERTRQYRGQTPPEWCGRDGKWVDVWLAEGPPAAARCGVYRDGFAAPLYRVARYSSYVQLNRKGTPTKTWTTMPEVMLAKCAEMLALRAAFPQELGGVYGAEEMGQAQDERPANNAPHADGKASPSRNEPRQGSNKPPQRNSPQQENKNKQTRLDSNGIQVPSSPCPVFEAEGPNKGKRWSDVLIEVIVAIYDGGRARMSRRQREWCEYLIAVDALKKKKAALEAEATAEAPKDGAA